MEKSFLKQPKSILKKKKRSHKNGLKYTFLINYLKDFHLKTGVP